MRNGDFAAQTFVYTLPLLVLAVWTLGEERGKRLAEAARFPSAWLLTLAIALPVAAFWVPHLIAYTIDRISWAQHWSGMPEAPVAADYLHLPWLEWHLVMYAFVAASSEWAWRGCVQPQFVRLFGISRGIFLVGLLYGSQQFLYFPLLYFFRFFGGLAQYFVGFLFQLLWGVVWSVVFGWLTLRARSVWPAVVCAALMSAIAQASRMDSVDMIPHRLIGLCLLGSGSVIAILLFRYLPLKSEPPGPSLAGTPVSESIS